MAIPEWLYRGKRNGSNDNNSGGGEAAGVKTAVDRTRLTHISLHLTGQLCLSRPQYAMTKGRERCNMTASQRHLFLLSTFSSSPVLLTSIHNPHPQPTTIATSTHTYASNINLISFICGRAGYGRDWRVTVTGKKCILVGSERDGGGVRGMPVSSLFPLRKPPSSCRHHGGSHPLPPPPLPSSHKPKLPLVHPQTPHTKHKPP